MSYLEYTVPEGGMTLTLLRQEGTVSLFASNKIQNPNSAFYDYHINGEGQVFVDLEDLPGERERRQAGNDAEGGVIIGDSVITLREGDLLFVSLEGIGAATNTFQIEASLGNTVGELITWRSGLAHCLGNNRHLAIQ